MIVDREIVDRFESDGFAMSSQFVTGDDLDELLEHVNRFIDAVLPGLPPEHVFYENKTDQSTLKQIQQMGSHDGWFHELLTASRFRDVAELLLNGAVTPQNLQYFNKPPSVGRSTPPHQDGYYFMIDPCEAVTMWLALDSTDEENGCVRYVCGSHQCGMREHARTNTLGFSQGISNYPTKQDIKDEIAMPAQRGDLIVHDALTIHRADKNKSTDRPRRALGFIYYSQRARIDDAAHAAYQIKLTADMKASGTI